MTAETLIASPDWLAARIDFDSRRVLFVPMTRALYSASPFLDNACFPGNRSRARGPSFDLPIADCVTGDGLPVHFIFHSCFCGSTLLSRLLDSPAALPIREPFTLTQIAMAGLVPWIPAARRLLARGYEQTRAVIVKGNDLANLIAEPMMVPEMGDPRSRAVFLSLDLRSFAIAALKDRARRSWLRRRMDIVGLDSGGTDAERAVRLWKYYESIRVLLPRTLSIDAADLFSQPQSTALKVAAWFDVPPLTGKQVQQIAAAHSKSGSKYGDDQRKRDLAALEKEFGAEVDSIL